MTGHDDNDDLLIFDPDAPRPAARETGADDYPFTVDPPEPDGPRRDGPAAGENIRPTAATDETDGGPENGVPAGETKTPQTGQTGSGDPQTAPRRRSRVAGGARKALSGEFLTDAPVRRHYPFVLFCVGLVFLYMTHVFHYRKLESTRIREQDILNSLRQHSLVLQAERTQATRRSRIVEMLRERGIDLHESLEAPRVIER